MVIQKKKSLALISSPLQLICLKEFLEKKEISNLEIFVFYSEEDSLKQLKSTSNFLNLEIERFVKSHNSVLWYLKLFFLKSYNFLILGAYFNSAFYFVHLISLFKKLIILDDGNATYYIGRYNPVKDSVFNKVFSWKYKRNHYFFTFYRMLDYKVIGYNDFSFLKSFLKTKKVENKILILGGNFVESMQMSFEQYKNHLNELKSKFGSSSLLYIPHRREKEFNYLRYEMEILKNDDCFEILLLKTEKLPKMIIGFFSTALITSKFFLNKNEKILIQNYPVIFEPYESYEMMKKLFDELKIENVKNKISN